MIKKESLVLEEKFKDIITKIDIENAGAEMQFVPHYITYNQLIKVILLTMHSFVQAVSSI